MAEPVPEDTNLDDFFAKKDKTKKKTKSRLTPADIETQMEKKLKKKSTVVKKKEKDSANSAQSSVLDVKLEEVRSLFSMFKRDMVSLKIVDFNTRRHNRLDVIRC